MVTGETFSSLALSFPDTVERPHFERTSFRVKNKIFATLAQDTEIATLKLSEENQSLFCAINNSAIHPVPNKWGARGWTFVELKKVSKELLEDTLNAAYQEVLKPKTGRNKK